MKSGKRRDKGEAGVAKGNCQVREQSKNLNEGGHEQWEGSGIWEKRVWPKRISDAESKVRHGQREPVTNGKDVGARKAGAAEVNFRERKQRKRKQMGSRE